MARPLELVLASKSPRRRELLSSLGWPFRVEESRFEESLQEGEPPEQMALRLALGKAAETASRFPTSWVVGADTIVVRQNKIMGKPRDDAHAFEMLSHLQGTSHDVFTAVALVAGGTNTAHTAVERTRVTFRPLSDEQLRAYVASGEGRDKAGSYAIQNKGALLVESIEGDYFNVVGLPLHRLSALLEKAGWPLLEQWKENRP